MIRRNRSIEKTTHQIEQLEQEHHLLHTLMNNIPDSIYFKDTESRFIRLSKALAMKFGQSDPSTLIGKTDFDLFTKEHAQQAFNDEQRILTTGIPEIDIIEKETWNDKRITWVSTTKMPLYDDTGKTIGTFGVSRDITSRKEIEDALKFRLTFEEYITSLSSKFISLDVLYIDDAVRDALRLIGKFTSSDRCFVLFLDDRNGSNERYYEWHGKRSKSKDRYLHPGSPKWLWDTLKNGIEVIVPCIDRAPHLSDTDKKALRKMSVQSFAYVPLLLTRYVGGIIGIESATDNNKWPEDITALLKIVGEVIMNAFSRKRAEEELQQANNILEQRVAQRTEDLNNANKLLKSHIGQLNFLNSSVYRLSPIIDTNELLPVILDVFMMRFPNAQGAICLLVDDGFDCTSTTPSFNHERNKECLHTAAIRIFGNGNLEPVCIKNRSTDKRLRTVKWTGIDKLNCYIAIPLIIDNTCRALLQVLTLEEHEAIFTAEQSILTTLAAHASICLSNAINYQQRTEKARLDGELDAARSIQHRFTPQQRPDIPNVGLKGVYLPAYKVGGDYLDYFKTERGDWVVVIADVCGKGIPAALLMTTIRSAFRIQAETETTAKALLCAVNKFMTFNIDERSFVTALCLIISRDGTHMSYARAGHLLLVKLPHEGGAPHNIACKGIALGLMQDVEMFADVMEEKNIPLISGDRYLLYTDGLIEAVNPQNKSYGYGRLHTLLTHDTTSNPEQLIDKIITDIRTFTNGAPDHDDLTLLSFRVL